MKSKILLLLFMTTVMGSCTQSSTSSDSHANNTKQTTNPNETNKNEVTKANESPSSSSDVEAENQNVGRADSSFTESSIQFVQDKYKIISEAIDYKTVPFETRCDERSSTKLERKYNKKGELSYLKLEECCLRRDFPGRAVCYLPAPPQIRTTGFPAYGSSNSRFRIKD